MADSVLDRWNGIEISTGLASRLMKPGVSEIVILDELGKRFEGKGGFEIAVGRNGKVWVDCSNSGDNAVKMTVAIGRCLTETDEQNLNPADQRKLVARILRDMKIDA
jgi:RNA-binding protein Rrp4 and related proteins (contain S1 domain and KH domain)